MGDLVLDRVVLAKGGLFYCVGGSEGCGGCIIIIEVDKLSISASVSPSFLHIPLGAVSSEVSLSSTVEAGASGLRGSILGVLRSVGVSDLHESSMCRICPIRSSLVAVCPGVVKIYRNCRIVHVLWGIG